MDNRSLVRIALFAAIIAVLSIIPGVTLPIAGGVPITAQTLGVMLAGILLGPRHGALAVLLFLFLIALGAPLASGGRGGLAVFYGVTAGFLVGFVPGAYVAGWLTRVLSARFAVWPAAFLGAMIGGVLVIYACGIPFLAWKTGMGLTKALYAMAIFVPGDILKAIAAAFVAEAAKSSFALGAKRA